jgi:hypothetical protein
MRFRATPVILYGMVDFAPVGQARYRGTAAMQFFADLSDLPAGPVLA